LTFSAEAGGIAHWLNRVCGRDYCWRPWSNPSLLLLVYNGSCPSFTI